jgi:phosphoribosylanthranilate isomerase
VDPELKFCGLTRRDDAAAAAALGASYVGVIFAGGPRELAPEAAQSVLAGANGGARRVGVFGASAPKEIAALAVELGLDVVQLHADPTPRDVEHLRNSWGGIVWAALRVGQDGLPTGADALFRAADAVVLDARAPGRLGGTGVPLDWPGLRAAVEGARRWGRLVLAGGLTPENVAEAVAALAPEVVDVSSGVEQAPGVKDHARMRAFALAARRHRVQA